MNNQLPHSGLGITSITLGAIAIFLLFFNTTFWLIFRFTKQLTQFYQIILGCLVVINVAIIIFGISNGLRGILQADRNRQLAYVGFIFNLVILLLYCVGIIIWLIR